jgi:hypothetical protein
VKATNGVGTGPSSPPSIAVIVGSPAPPTGVVAKRVAAGQLKVTFTPGANNGAVIISYTATCASKNGGVVRTKTGPSSPLTVIALTAGKTYTCAVRGTNSRGMGKPSIPSAPVAA